jgi:predicted HicB family RNase H-like nuclease
MKDDVVKLMLRIDPELHRCLVEEAKTAVRSLNNEIKWRLRQSLERQQDMGWPRERR